jgi:F420-non-reducing hydrogenase small subunit
VDYYMPGCPPESHQIAAVIDLVIKVMQGKAELPPKGTVIGAGNSTVCDECKRTRNVKHIKEFHRIQKSRRSTRTVPARTGRPCNGPATRSGCNARCPQVGAQCIGCYGPAEGVLDYGARLITAFASVIDANEPEEIEKHPRRHPRPDRAVLPLQPGRLLRESTKACLGERRTCPIRPRRQL